jgi:hypothetical protein
MCPAMKDQMSAVSELAKLYNVTQLLDEQGQTLAWVIFPQDSPEVNEVA